MPKEKINDGNATANGRPIPWDYEVSQGADNSDSPGAWVPDGETIRDAELSVGWLKDSWVQLSIEGDISYFRMATEQPFSNTVDRTTVFTPPLSRDEINKLIKALRRARDAVHGRDE